MRTPALLVLGVAVGLSACTDAGPGPGTGGDGNGAEEAEALRLGRVHVVLSTPGADNADAPDAPDAPDALDATDRHGFELTARFAVVRGLEEEFVRARADMPDLLEDLLNPGQCATESALWPSELAPNQTNQADFTATELGRELLLVDVGELEVQLGEARLSVPLTLVPDLLPYMSGVEYAYFADSPVQPEMNDPETVTVIAAGGLTDELPAFTVASPMPGALGLTYTPEDLASLGGAGGGALVVRWDTKGDDNDTVGLRLTPMLSGEPLGDDIVCLVADRGQTRLDLTELRTLGFAPDADTVRIEASRSRTSLFDVGAWVGTELVVERRDTAELPLR
ncbi:MAG: hypothetical protein KUG77_19640 [Nannocystaceae bacterium]|nr:hypothetical protein [Nannocystaceae bacterium]